MEPLRFTAEHLTRPSPSGIDVETTLEHFAILTYCVDPEVLRGHLHPRYEPDCIVDSKGNQKALISVVPFLDLDFRFSNCPWPRFRFAQTNYRAYVTDTETGEHVAWFFGTSLDTPFVAVPHHLWKLPWYGGRIQLDARYDSQAGRFKYYSMKTASKWAPAELELEDSGDALEELQGFPDLETGLVLLTHPIKGIFYRRDGRLGSYSIWHDRLEMTRGSAIEASFGLLDNLDLVCLGDLSGIHSVLLQKSTDFTIYLPPKPV